MSKITNTSAVHDNGVAQLQLGIGEDRIVIKRKGGTVEILDKDGNKVPLEGGSGVYVGDGQVPEGHNVKINPNGSILKIPQKTSELQDDIGIIPESQKGAANGVATLDENGDLNPEQMPKHNHTAVKFVVWGADD